MIPRERLYEYFNPMTARHVKDVRKRILRVSQRELADLMGVTQTTVSRWESGRSPCGNIYARVLFLLVNSERLVEKSLGVRTVMTLLGQAESDS